jgi:hypothetical protein
MRWAGHLALIGMRKGVYGVLVGKPEENILPGRCNRWEGNIKMDLRELGSEGMDWIDLAQEWDKC